MLFDFFKKKKKYEYQIGDIIEFNSEIYCIVKVDDNFISIINKKGKILNNIYYIDENIKILNKFGNRIYKLDKKYIKQIIENTEYILT